MPRNPPAAAYYELGQACRNGHPITAYGTSSPQRRSDYCSECGAPTITACENCSAPLHGDYVVPGVFGVGVTWTPDRHCYACGKPYPWTSKGTKAAHELTAMLSGLTDDKRDALDRSFDDLVRDTPATTTAAMRVKMLLPKIGKEGADALRKVLVDIATEAAKKQIGL